MIRVDSPFVGMFIHTKRVGQLMLLCVSIALCSGTVAFATPDYYVLRQATVAGGISSTWDGVASSSDGTKLAVIMYDGYIHTSTDSGATWTQQGSSGSRSWRTISSSTDGAKLAAAAYGGYIYTSTDSGVTWVEQTAAGMRSWRTLASSADGTKLIAADYGGYIYTSTDSGATWTEHTDAGSQVWWSVASNADGTVLGAAAINDYVYISTDAGATWTQQTDNGLNMWSSLAMSADGNTITASVYQGGIFTSSDRAATWVNRSSTTGPKNWWYVTANSDGTKQIALDTGGYMYTSNDSGATWTQQTANDMRYWNAAAMTSDGSKVILSEEIGNIYLAATQGSITTNFDIGTLPSSGNVQSTIANTKLSVTSSTCYTIDSGSVTSVGASGLVVPDTRISLLGGVAFSINCMVPGGVAPFTITLGDYIQDESSLHIYKENPADNTLVDITSSVIVRNTVIDGKPVTTVEYSLMDGGAFDQDGVKNGIIVDPIYFGVASTLAATGENTQRILMASSSMLLAGVILLVTIFLHRGRRIDATK